jgi:hypothetical protein
MTVSITLLEMRRMMGGNSAEKESLASISSTSTVVTRSRTEEKLGVETTSTCFMHNGVK